MGPHDDEREALEALIASEGWRRFCAHVEAEWGPEAYRRRIGQALGLISASGDQEANAKATVFQIEASAREVERVARWPQERLTHLRKLMTSATSMTASRWPQVPYGRE